MYKFNQMIGKPFNEVVKACKKSAILKSLASGALFYFGIKLFDEAAHEHGFVDGVNRACKGVDNILTRMEKKGKFSNQDFVDEIDCYNDEQSEQ